MSDLKLTGIVALIGWGLAVIGWWLIGGVIS
jgi:hypothetical protein